MLACLLSACGGSGGSDPASPHYTCSTLQGHYINHFNPANTLDIDGACNFTDSYCGYAATYTIPEYTTGATVITISGTNGAVGCMSSTAHTCTLLSDGVQLGVDCDSNAVQYVFDKQ